MLNRLIYCNIKYFNEKYIAIKAGVAKFAHKNYKYA